MFKLTIETDNAAFERNSDPELRRILQRLIKEETLVIGNSGKLRDINGNTVGHWEVA